MPRRPGRGSPGPPRRDLRGGPRYRHGAPPPLRADLRARNAPGAGTGRSDSDAGSPRAVPLAPPAGGGGMGVVYEAFDEKLERRVALKLIRSDQLVFADSRRRFEREVRAAGRLDHPNLCPIYGGGELGGVPFLAMRYVEGQSLAAWIRQRREVSSAPSSSRGARSRLGLDVALVIEKVARALHAAHEAGVVHRDVKPANVLIDAAGEPVLVDFRRRAGRRLLDRWPDADWRATGHAGLHGARAGVGEGRRRPSHRRVRPRRDALRVPHASLSLRVVRAGRALPPHPHGAAARSARLRPLHRQRAQCRGREGAREGPGPALRQRRRARRGVAPHP